MARRMNEGKGEFDTYMVFICDGCGKEERGMRFSEADGGWFKPAKWYARSDKDGEQVACSRECIVTVAKKTGKTDLVAPFVFAFIFSIGSLMGCSTYSKHTCKRYEKIVQILNCNGQGLCEVVTDKNHHYQEYQPTLEFFICTDMGK